MLHPICRNSYVTTEWIIIANETFLLPYFVVECLTVLLLKILLYLLACELIKVYQVFSLFCVLTSHTSFLDLIKMRLVLLCTIVMLILFLEW